MINFYDVIAASEGIAVADEFATLWGRKISGGYVISTYTGTLPAVLQTVAGYLEGYKIWGNTGDVGLKTEQLFSATNSEGGYLDADGSVVSPQHVNFRHTDFLPLPLDANDITVSYEDPSGTGMNAPALCFYDVNKTYLTGESFEGARTKTFTIPENARYFRTSYRSTMTAVNIVAGTTPATSDIPYGYKLSIMSNDTTTDVYIGDSKLDEDEWVDSETGKIYKWGDITGLSEPLCGINTYSDVLDLSTGGLTRRIKKLVLTGSASDPVRKIGGNAPYAYYYEPTGMEGSARNACLCTHVPFSWSYSGETPAIVIGSTLNQFFINFGKTTMDAQPSGNTAEGFKEFCAAQYAAGTPVTVWYVLAEPEVTTVTVPSGLTGTIEGYLVHDGTPTPEAPIYPTANGVKQTDGTYSIESAYLAPTDPPAPLPQIPTAAGETTISYGGAGAQPEKVELKYRK